MQRQYKWFPQYVGVQVSSDEFFWNNHVIYSEMNRGWSRDRKLFDYLIHLLQLIQLCWEAYSMIQVPILPLAMQKRDTNLGNDQLHSN